MFASILEGMEAALGGAGVVQHVSELHSELVACDIREKVPAIWKEMDDKVQLLLSSMFYTTYEDHAWIECEFTGRKFTWRHFEEAKATRAESAKWMRQYLVRNKMDGLYHYEIESFVTKVAYNQHLEKMLLACRLEAERGRLHNIWNRVIIEFLSKVDRIEPVDFPPPLPDPEDPLEDWYQGMYGDQLKQDCRI